MLAQRAAAALMAASGGRGVTTSHPAQRLVREASFYSIQAQVPSTREMTLDALAEG
ncbi:MAG: hypothetical protein ACRDYD_07180 [Acidimicrobiales bacterium]